MRVTRPVAERELIEALGMVTALKGRPVASNPLERRRRVGALRVLVAEDNLIAQEFAAEALRRLGHSIAVASDGPEALAMLKREIFDLRTDPAEKTDLIEQQSAIAEGLQTQLRRWQESVLQSLTGADY